MQIIETISAMRGWSEAERRQNRLIAFVPTMGFLHEGHLCLVRAARKRGDRVVVSIFVNPTQFSPGEDFAAYPRNFARDHELLANENVDVLFHPAVDELYPAGGQTHVDVEKLSLPLCGASRPGHFRGVATVVTKLFNIVLPHVAIFGEKDFQQLQIIRQLVRDLSMGCRNRRPPDRTRAGWFGDELAQLLSHARRSAAPRSVCHSRCAKPSGCFGAARLMRRQLLNWSCRRSPSSRSRRSSMSRFVTSKLWMSWKRSIDRRFSPWLCASVERA